MTTLEAFNTAARLVGFSEEEIAKRNKYCLSVMPFTHMQSTIPPGEEVETIFRFIAGMCELDRLSPEQRETRQNELLEKLKELEKKN